MVPQMATYTNLDIPSELDNNIKQMKEVLAKLKEDNSNLKDELSKKQTLSNDLQQPLSTFDQDKYKEHL